MLDLEEQVIYYSERTVNKISRIDFDGSNNELITDDSNGVNQIEFDPIEIKLYVVDESGDMYKMDTDGTNMELVSDNLNEIHSYKLDYCNRKIYFTEIGDSPGISRMNFDGTDVELIHVPSEGIAYGVEIDFLENRIYYNLDASTIQSVNFDGTDETTMSSGLVNPVGIVLEKDCGIISSVDEVQSTSGAVLYPNPLNSDHTISIESDLFMISELQLVDTRGSLLKTKTEILNMNTELDLQFVGPGIYYLSIQYVNGSSEVLKVVKHF